MTATSSYAGSSAARKTSSPFFATSRPTNSATKRSGGKPKERRSSSRSPVALGRGMPTGRTRTSRTLHCSSTQAATAGLSVATTVASRTQRPTVARAVRSTASSAAEPCGTKPTCCVSTLGVPLVLASARAGSEVAYSTSCTWTTSASARRRRSVRTSVTGSGTGYGTLSLRSSVYDAGIRSTVTSPSLSASGASSYRQQTTVTSWPRSASPPARISVKRSTPPIRGRKLALTRRTRNAKPQPARPDRLRHAAGRPRCRRRPRSRPRRSATASGERRLPWRPRSGARPRRFRT